MPSVNRLSYSKRLFLWLLVYSLMLVGGFVLYQYKREKDFKAAEINSQLQLINSFILSELAEGTSPRDIRLNEFYPFEDIRLSVISPAGDVVYDNTLDTLPGANHLGREEIHKAVKNGEGFALRRHSESTGDNYFYSARQGRNGFIVRTAVPYSLQLTDLLKADFGFLWATALIAFVMCTVGYFATRRVGIHILRLNRFAENVERGDKISDSEPFPHDELGEISNHIVRLYARLQQATADRDSEHRAAMREQQEKERIKKQLTNNINHELKTPVSAIQVCVETMLAHPNLTDEKKKEFLNRCLANTQRLNRLLADVSMITRMDDGGAAIMKETLNLCDIIEETVDDYRPLAESKSMVINCNISGRIMVEANRSLLESIFSNLIDNAIAYSGGSAINMKVLAEDDESVMLSISDNGVGVGPEHLPRVFERFYRIDKGRSRAAGGTGLGLSIVKNAVLIHGGKINVRNVLGGGLEFIITLPRLH